MSHVDILLDFCCFFYLEIIFVKNVIRFLIYINLGVYQLVKSLLYNRTWRQDMSDSHLGITVQKLKELVEF